jgi:BirA family biotin operon repressor/biotin-[acetyl-CoA-carboxylase] ligase
LAIKTFLSTGRHSVSVQIDERVREVLAAETRFSDIDWLGVTDSTNRVAAVRAEQGAPEGLVIGADVQTAGRGRLDRLWESRSGEGLLVSVLLRPHGLPPHRWHLLTAAAALAAKEACRRVAAVDPQLKWPNDLMLSGSDAGYRPERDTGGGKLAGILAESSAGAVVLGMGLNVHGGPPGAAVLDWAAGKRVCRLALLTAWLRDLDRRLDRWDQVARDYRVHCATIGRDVAVETGGEQIQGRAEGLDASGRLLLRRPDGTVDVIAAGDVIHLR